ncbi:MAG: tetratricopeptide repeat protein [bacterium]|nr:tetratricopeptide repeat protein [bacterium]
MNTILTVYFCDEKWFHQEKLKNLVSTLPHKINGKIKEIKGDIRLLPLGEYYSLKFAAGNITLEKLPPDYVPGTDNPESPEEDLSHHSILSFHCSASEENIVSTELILAKELEDCWFYPSSNMEKDSEEKTFENSIDCGTDDEFCGKISALATSGKFKEALDLCRFFFKNNSNKDISHIYDCAASLYRESGLLYKALTYARLACLLQPDLPSLYENTARVYNNLDNYRESLAWLNKAIETDPAYLSARLNQARFHLAYEEPDQALAAVSQARKIAPADDETLLLAARIYEANGQLDPARETYEMILEKYMDNMEVLSGLCLVYNDLDEIDKAVAIRERIIELDPSDDGSLYIMGFLKLRMGAYNEARDWLLRARSLGNHESWLYLALGLSLYHQGMVEEAEINFARAVEAAEELLRINPDSPVCIESVILACIANKETEKALALIENSFRFSTEFGQFLKLMTGFPLAAGLIPVTEYPDL